MGLPGRTESRDRSGHICAEGGSSRGGHNKRRFSLRLHAPFRCDRPPFCEGRVVSFFETVCVDTPQLSRQTFDLKIRRRRIASTLVSEFAVSSQLRGTVRALDHKW